MGVEIARRGFVPALILCSTAKRTAETLEMVLPFLLPAPEVRLDPALYLAAPQTILKRIAGVTSETSSIMVIGHNPGMHQLAFTLGEGGEGAGRLGEKFPTAGFASLRSNAAAWAVAVTGAWTLETEFRPSDL